MSNGNGTLTKLTEATRMLAEAKTLDDVLKIKDLAQSAETYARAAKLGLEAQNNAAEVTLRAERKAGEILSKMKERGELQKQGDYKKYHDDTFSPPKLGDLGITRVESSRWQQIAELPEVQFEAFIVETRADGKELTTSGTLKEAKDYGRQEERKQKSEDGAKVNIPADTKIIVGDFRERIKDIPDNSVDFIFTDPPYDKDSIPLYEDLAREAARVLKSGGSLICYVGHYAIPEILNRMTPHLRYWWTLCCKHNGNSARLTGVNVFVEWKPMLWFVKGTRGGKLDFVSDLIESNLPTKDDHDWQQSDAEARYYIEHLTNEGDMVLDPFAGSGTTLIAAHQLNRNSIGIEIDGDNANITKSRISKN